MGRGYKHLCKEVADGKVWVISPVVDKMGSDLVESLAKDEEMGEVPLLPGSRAEQAESFWVLAVPVPAEMVCLETATQEGSHSGAFICFKWVVRACGVYRMGLR